MTEGKELTQIQSKAMTLRSFLYQDKIKTQFAEVVPKWMSADRLLRVAFSSILKNPQLMDCSRESLLGAIMQCAQLGLEPILGRAHLVPYRNNRKPGNPLECQFQIGYQGFIDLAERTGKFESITAHVVYENDKFSLDYGSNEHIRHTPELKKGRGEPIGAYTMWTRKTGAKNFTFMSIYDIYKIRDKSQAYQYAKKNNRTDSPWIEWPSEMMKKTVIKRHSKLEPLSIDFMEAVELDNRIEAYGTTSMPYIGDMFEAEAPKLDDASQAFVEKVPSDTDMELLETFTAECAAYHNTTSMHVKAEAVKDWDQFWGGFQKWLKKESQKVEIRKRQKEIEAEIEAILKKRKTGLRTYMEKNWKDLPNRPPEIQDTIVKHMKHRFGVDYTIGMEPVFEPQEPEPEDKASQDETGYDEDQEKKDDGTEEATVDLSTKLTCPQEGQNPGEEVALGYCRSLCPKRDECDEWQLVNAPKTEDEDDGKTDEGAAPGQGDLQF